MKNIPKEYTSLWEYYKERSLYHFDKWRQDSPGEYFKVLGNLEPTWKDELNKLKEQSIPRTFLNIGFSAGRNQKTFRSDLRTADIARGGGDISKMEILNTLDDFTDFPELQKVIDYFGLERVQTRCNIQRTGQVFTTHIDQCQGHFNGKDTGNPKENPDFLNRIVRITVMLEDWVPGQFIIFGNYVYQQWKAGDFYMHDWENIPHATANASEQVRPTLQMTGLRTEKTDNIIGHIHFKRKYP